MTHPVSLILVFEAQFKIILITSFYIVLKPTLSNVKPGFTPELCCAKMRKVEQMLLQLPLAHGQIFGFRV